MSELPSEEVSGGGTCAGSCWITPNTPGGARAWAGVGREAGPQGARRQEGDGGSCHGSSARAPPTPHQ